MKKYLFLICLFAILAYLSVFSYTPLGFRTSADKIHDWITALIVASIILAIIYFVKSAAKFAKTISIIALTLITLFALATGWEIITMNFQLLGLLEKVLIGTFLLWLSYFNYHLSNNLEVV